MGSNPASLKFCTRQVDTMGHTQQLGCRPLLTSCDAQRRGRVPLARTWNLPHAVCPLGKRRQSEALAGHPPRKRKLVHASLSVSWPIVHRTLESGGRSNRTSRGMEHAIASTRMATSSSSSSAAPSFLFRNGYNSKTPHRSKAAGDGCAYAPEHKGR